jgi:hypothetical protein
MLSKREDSPRASTVLHPLAMHGTAIFIIASLFAPQKHEKSVASGHPDDWPAADRQL